VGVGVVTDLFAVYCRFCKAHIFLQFHFLVSWFNSHCLTIRYTLNVYSSTTIFNFFDHVKTQ
jgi:hypothetical protein